jgi:hypothetical protein
MTDKALGNLTPRMKERLEKWRKNTLPVKSAEKVRGPSPLKRRYVRGDYGDDMSDFEELHNKKLLEGKK